MKSKFWMTVLALFCLGVGLLSGGCVYYPYYPQSSQRDELRPLVGGSGALDVSGAVDLTNGPILPVMP